MENERKKLFEVNGFTVYEDSKIKLDNKKDDEVFEGLKQPTTIKFDGTPVKCTAPFFTTNQLDPNDGYYDLGFEEDSIHYRFLSSDAERKERVKDLEKNLIEPFLKKNKKWVNKETKKQEVLNRTILLGDEEYYDQYSFEVVAGNTLLARNVEDRFKIYMLLLKKTVCPVEMQDSSEFAQSSLTITDLVSKVQKTQSRSKSIGDASYYLTSMIKDGKLDMLCSYFEYLGLRHFLSADSDEVQFQDFIQTNIINSDKYREAFLDTKENKTEDEIRIYSLLTKALKKSNVDFEKVGNVFIHKGEEVGSDLKIIAKDLSTTKEESKLDFVKDLMNNL